MTRLLLVEDDKDIARALKLRFAAHGFEVSVAYDATTAMTVARQCKPDLVVMDISMPGGDGFVVGERLEAAFGYIPTIFITANSHPALHEKALAQGASGFFQKPLDTKRLIAAAEAISAKGELA